MKEDNFSRVSESLTQTLPQWQVASAFRIFGVMFVLKSYRIADESPLAGRSHAVPVTLVAPKATPDAFSFGPMAVFLTNKEHASYSLHGGQQP